MGVVRREGDWRLEKRGKGVYEITYQRETQVKVLTSSAPSNARNGMAFDVVPVREVNSYSEAEGLFEEKAHGPPPLGMTPSTGGSGSSGGSLELGGEDVDLSDLPPYGIGFVFLVAGGFLLYTFWDAGNSIILLVGVGFLIAGILPFGYAGYLFRTEDWRTAWNFLVTVEGDSQSGTSSDDTSKTPPAPENLKNKLIFDRSNQQCEWCEESYDHLQVHHIEPRSEGGPNEPENLIVLCPNCHENADREAIPRSKLRAKVKRLPEIPSQ